MEYPYSDEYMIYNKTRHRYILTEKAVLDDLNIELGEVLAGANTARREREIQKFLTYISNLVYREVYKYNEQRDLVEYILAKCPSAREKLKQAMEEQIEYFMFNGDISVYSGVDFKKGTKGQSVADRVLSPNARDLLLEPLTETKVPILYCGKYGILFTPKYEEENY